MFLNEQSFQKYLDQELADLYQEVPVEFTVQAAKGLEELFAQFVSTEHAAQAISTFDYVNGAGFEVEMGTPLQYLYTGTGIYGPEEQTFIVASPHNVLSWEEDGERRFASVVYNPGQPSKFTEEDMVQAMVDAINSSEDKL